MQSTRLIDFLDGNKVKYVILRHSPAFTAQEIAASAHVKGQEMAKTVIVKLDGKLAMAVLPASHRVDFAELKKAAAAREASLVPEQEYKDLFPDCVTGAMPPFGNLYGMEVLVSRALTQNKDISFNACNFSEMVRLPFEEYKRLVKPRIADFSVHRERRAAA